ncbi:MAG: 3D domain-containing protein, partial [Eubacteriales bacterium]|nr:3D domain-containing protein [Eubacteriales bacterium]
KERSLEPGRPVRARKRAPKRVAPVSGRKARAGSPLTGLGQAFVLVLAAILLIGVSSASQEVHTTEVVQAPVSVMPMPDRVDRSNDSDTPRQPPVPDKAVAVAPVEESPEKPEIALTSRSTGQTVRMLATAYTLECGNGDGRTATGTTPRPGIIAVDPKVIPHGTLVYINDFGYFRAEDTGGVIKGERIDVFMHSRTDALKFGSRWVDVKIIGKFEEPGLVRYYPR